MGYIFDETELKVNKSLFDEFLVIYKSEFDGMIIGKFIIWLHDNKPEIYKKLEKSGKFFQEAYEMAKEREQLLEDIENGYYD